MAVPAYSHIRWQVIVATAIAAFMFSACGFSLDYMSAFFTIGLARYGGTLHKYSHRIDHAVSIMPDDTIWAAFPTEGKGGLARRKGSQSPGRDFLHVSPSGKVISHCSWHMPADSDLDFFPRTEGGFTIRTDASIISLNSDCTPIAQIARPSGTMVYGTSDHEMIILSMQGAAIRILNAKTLARIAVLSLPPEVINYKISVWNHLILIRDTPDGKCYWAYLPSLTEGSLPTWHRLASPDPEMVRTFGDDATISSNWSTPHPNLYINGVNGTTIYSFPLGTSMRPDTSLFPEGSCVSPASSRAGIFLYDRRRTWLGKKEITGEHVSVINFKTSQVLLSLPVTEYDPLLNCSLSKNGRTFAILRGLNLSVFNLPQ